MDETVVVPTTEPGIKLKKTLCRRAAKCLDGTACLANQALLLIFSFTKETVTQVSGRALER